MVTASFVQAEVTLVTDRAKISASSFDGFGTVGDPVARELSDISTFSDSVSQSDDLNQGRSASAQAAQLTTADFSDPLFARIRSTGSAQASWTDGAANDGRDPAGMARSEFTITVQITGVPSSFSLSGELETTADSTNANCTQVSVTSPSGSSFNFGSPTGCGTPSQSISESGVLQPGTYVFTVIADASASNPGATAGSALASFDLTLSLGCTITGTDGNDTLTGDAEDNIICGLDGEDTINGLGGDDRIFGGGGIDTITAGAGDDVVNGDEGGDSIDGGAGNDEIFGGGGDDVITGDDSVIEIAGELVLCGGQVSLPGFDDDVISGGDGNDSIGGCQGADTIRGDAGDDDLFGNTGNDKLFGGIGSDTLRGTAGNDTLVGDDPGSQLPRKDSLFGGGGNDILRARDGVRDVVNGGPGANDRAKVDNRDRVTGVERRLP